MEDDVKRQLFDPYAAQALVLSHRPAEASAVKENSNVSIDYTGEKVNKVIVRGGKK